CLFSGGGVRCWLRRFRFGFLEIFDGGGLGAVELLQFLEELRVLLPDEFGVVIRSERSDALVAIFLESKDFPVEPAEAANNANVLVHVNLRAVLSRPRSEKHFGKASGGEL